MKKGVKTYRTTITLEPGLFRLISEKAKLNYLRNGPMIHSLICRGLESIGYTEAEIQKAREED